MSIERQLLNEGLDAYEGSNNVSILLNDGSGVSHKCRTVWRLDDEIGAEFV